MAFREETGWLIELLPSVASQPTWYGETDEGALGWTTDSLKAVRFARSEDAQRVMECEGFTEAHPSDHRWCDYSHNWEFRKKFNFECCSDCGVVKRDDGKNGPCKGPMKLRPMEKSWPLDSSSSAESD